MWLCGVIGMNTKGIPSPSVENAMFTPPAVFAYWVGGTILQGGQGPPQEPNGPKVATASVPGLPLPLQSAELYLGRREPAGAAQSTALLHPARHRRLRRTVVLRRLPERRPQPERVQLGAPAPDPPALDGQLRLPLREVG